MVAWKPLEATHYHGIARDRALLGECDRVTRVILLLSASVSQLSCEDSLSASVDLVAVARVAACLRRCLAAGRRSGRGRTGIR